MANTVTSKGQVTIPKPIRDHLGIKPGSAVEFTQSADGDIVIQRAEGKLRGQFANLRGTAGPGMTTDEIMALLRGEPE